MGMLVLQGRAPVVLFLLYALSLVAIASPDVPTVVARRKLSAAGFIDLLSAFLRPQDKQRAESASEESAPNSEERPLLLSAFKNHLGALDGSNPPSAAPGASGPGDLIGNTVKALRDLLAQGEAVTVGPIEASAASAAERRSLGARIDGAAGGAGAAFSASAVWRRRLDPASDEEPPAAFPLHSSTEALLNEVLLRIPPSELTRPDAAGICTVPNIHWYHAGNWSSHAPAASARACGEKCADDRSCAFFTYALPVRACTFFPRRGTRGYLADQVISGPAACGPGGSARNLGRAGSGHAAPSRRRLAAADECFADETEILGARLFVQGAIGAPATCQKLCARAEGCRYFSHFAGDARCELFSDAHGVTQSLGVVAGPKECGNVAAGGGGGGGGGIHAPPPSRGAAYAESTLSADSIPLPASAGAGGGSGGHSYIGQLMLPESVRSADDGGGAGGGASAAESSFVGTVLRDDEGTSVGAARVAGPFGVGPGPLGSLFFGGGGGDGIGFGGGGNGGVLGLLSNFARAAGASRETEGVAGGVLSGAAAGGAPAVASAQNLIGAMQSVMAAGDTVMKTFPIADLVKTGYQLSNSGLLRPAGSGGVVNRYVDSAPPEGVGAPEVLCLSEGMRCCVPREAAPNFQKAPPTLNEVASPRCQATYVSASDQLCATTRYADSACGTQVVETTKVTVYRNRMAIPSRTMNDALCECALQKGEGEDGRPAGPPLGVAKWFYSLVAAEEDAEAREKRGEAAAKLGTAAKVGATWLDALGTKREGGGSAGAAAGGGSASSFLNSIIDLADEMKTRKGGPQGGGGRRRLGAAPAAAKAAPAAFADAAAAAEAGAEAGGAVDGAAAVGGAAIAFSSLATASSVAGAAAKVPSPVSGALRRLRTCSIVPRDCVENLATFLADPHRCAHRIIVQDGCLVPAGDGDVRVRENRRRRRRRRRLAAAPDGGGSAVAELSVSLPQAIGSVAADEWQMTCDFSPVADGDEEWEFLPAAELAECGEADAAALAAAAEAAWAEVADAVVRSIGLLGAFIEDAADVDAVARLFLGVGERAAPAAAEPAARPVGREMASPSLLASPLGWPAPPFALTAELEAAFSPLILAQATFMTASGGGGGGGCGSDDACLVEHDFATYIVSSSFNVPAGDGEKAVLVTA